MSHIKTSVSSLIKKYKTRCPYELADHLGIEIFEYAFRKIRGLIFYLGERKILGVKANLPEHEKRAIIAHEIGHEELHPANVGYFFIKEQTNFVPGRYEHEADIFAAMLLVDEPPEYGETVEKYAARSMVLFFARAFSIKLQVIFPYYCISISHNVANPVLSLYSIKSKEYAGIKYLNLSTNINGGENSPPLAS